MTKGQMDLIYRNSDPSNFARLPVESNPKQSSRVLRMETPGSKHAQREEANIMAEIMVV